ncbi:hypothetical protein [Streptomyces sp. NPDC058398]
MGLIRSRPPTPSAADPLRRRHIEDARQLALVLRLCIEKDVGLLIL